MSVVKGFYNWGSIKNSINNGDFNSFDRWIIAPAVRIFQDDMSSNFSRSYNSLDISLREVYFNALKDDDSNFCEDLVKLINVMNHKKNTISHEKAIKKYKNLFVVKWSHKMEKYQNLI